MLRLRGSCVEVYAIEIGKETGFGGQVLSIHPFRSLHFASVEECSVINAEELVSFYFSNSDE